MKLYFAFLIFGLFGSLVLSNPAASDGSSSPDASQIAAVLQAAAAEAKAAAEVEKSSAEAKAEVSSGENQQKAEASSSPHLSSASLALSAAAASVAAASAQKKNNKGDKSGYGYGNGNGYGVVGGGPGYGNPGYGNIVAPSYGNVGSGGYGGNGGSGVQTVLNFYPQQNGTGYGGNYNTSTPAPPANGTHNGTDYQKPVNYVIYIQPQAVYGQGQKPNYGLNYQPGVNVYGSGLPQNTGYGVVPNTGYGVVPNTGYGAVPNTGYGVAPNQYGGSQQQYSGVNSAQLGYGIQANYLQNPSVSGYGGGSSVVAPAGAGYSAGAAYGGGNAYNQRPTYNQVVVPSNSAYAGNAGYGNQPAEVYQAAGASGGSYGTAPVQVYSQPALAVAGYPTVQVAAPPAAVSSYHGSASASGAYGVRPQKPQSVYVSSYNQPQTVYAVKPGKPALSSYGVAKPQLSYSGSYGKQSPAQAQAQAQVALSKHTQVLGSLSKPQQLAAYGSGGHAVIVALDEDQAEFKKSKAAEEDLKSMKAEKEEKESSAVEEVKN